RNTLPIAMATGPDGALWLTLQNEAVARLSVDGTFRFFALPASGWTAESDDAASLAVGPDGALWATRNRAICRIGLDGQTRAFPLPVGRYGPSPLGPTVGAITAGPDGAMWFIEAPDRIGRVTMDGDFSDFPIPTHGSQYGGITAGPDGNLWF